MSWIRAKGPSLVRTHLALIVWTYRTRRARHQTLFVQPDNAYNHSTSSRARGRFGWGPKDKRRFILRRGFADRSVGMVSGGCPVFIHTPRYQYCHKGTIVLRRNAVFSTSRRFPLPRLDTRILITSFSATTERLHSGSLSFISLEITKWKSIHQIEHW